MFSRNITRKKLKKYQIEQQKVDRHATSRPWQRPWRPQKTINHKSVGGNVTNRVVYSIVASFITVDCCLDIRFCDLVKFGPTMAMATMATALSGRVSNGFG